MNTDLVTVLTELRSTVEAVAHVRRGLRVVPLPWLLGEIDRLIAAPKETRK